MNPYQGLKHLQPKRYWCPDNGSNQHESLSGIETCCLAEANVIRGFQSTWIPIRDWNLELARSANIPISSNQHESLSGIETHNESTPSLTVTFQSTWIPIRDWNKFSIGNTPGDRLFQSTWIPIRDWNTRCLRCRPSSSRSNQHESLSGIETGKAIAWSVANTSSNQHESLSGIETFYPVQGGGLL